MIPPLQQQTLGEAASTSDHTLQVDVRRKLASYLFSLQVSWCRVHLICDGDFRRFNRRLYFHPSLFGEGHYSTFQLTLQSAPSNFFTDRNCHYPMEGECHSIIRQPSHLNRWFLFNLILYVSAFSFVLLFHCFYLYLVCFCLFSISNYVHTNFNHTYIIFLLHIVYTLKLPKNILHLFLYFLELSSLYPSTFNNFTPFYIYMMYMYSRQVYTMKY